MVENIPKGYKKTEVGVIPEEWECVELGSTSRYEGGSQPPLSTFSNRKKKDYIRLIQIRDYKTDRYTTYIPITLAKRFCNEDEIMIGRYGPPIFQILRGINGAYNVALMKAIPLENITNGFLYYTLKRADLFKYIELLSQRSSGQTGVDLVGLKSYLIPLPSLSEQQDIETVLMDIDRLISSLRNLIYKKKNIKQGVMQDLLTGKKRVSGFSGEWEKKTVNDITVSISSGITGKRGDTGEYEVFGSTGVIAHTNSYDYEGESILVARVGANAGRTNLVNGKYGVSDNTLIINLVDDQNKLFWYYKLINYGLNKLIFGSGQPLITGGQLKSLTFSYPMEEEQTAIAKILSDMDTEIETLNQKLTKYKDIKQGMMQELLTGKRRLIHND